MDKLQIKLRAVEDEHAEEVLNNHLEKHANSKRDRAIFILGNIRATDRISKALNSQAMIAAFAFQKEDLHEALGYPAFADFLDNSEFSPMSKHEFYERKKVFENEGEKVFDALNDMDIPLKTRRLLGKGNVQLDGEDLVILDPATGEEMKFEITNKSRILETISALADANADKSKKLERGASDNHRLKQRITELQNEVLESEQNGNYVERDEIENYYMLVGSMMKRLNDLLENAPIVRVAQFETRNLRVLAAQFQQTNNVVAKKLPGGTGAGLDDTDEDRLASLLDDED